MFRFDCLKSKEDYISSGFNLIENQDGTVSVFDSQGRNSTTVLMNKSCCEAIGYQFNEINQRCLWKREETEDNEGFKIILNPEGNHGTLFGVDENETCCLDVSFDYMFKFDCEDLVNAVTDTTITTGDGNKEEISQLQGELLNNDKLISYYQNLINELNEVPYVIECGGDSSVSSTIDSGVELYQGSKTDSAYSNKNTGSNKS